MQRTRINLIAWAPLAMASMFVAETSALRLQRAIASSSAFGIREERIEILNQEIRVAKLSSDSFLVTGEHFSGGKAVHIRVKSGLDPYRYFDTVANDSGRFELQVSGMCSQNGKIGFSASDDRMNPGKGTGTLWSQSASAYCSSTSFKRNPRLSGVS